MLNAINTWLQWRPIYSHALSNMKYYIIQTVLYMPRLLANIAPHIVLLTLPQPPRSLNILNVDQDLRRLRLTSWRGSVDRSVGLGWACVEDSRGENGRARSPSAPRNLRSRLHKQRVSGYGKERREGNAVYAHIN